MKSLLLLICLFSVVASESYAQEDMRGASDTYEVSEHELEEFEVKAQTGTQEVIPDEVYSTKKGRAYIVTNSGVDAEILRAFETLPEDKRSNFHNIRHRLLQKVAAFLDSQSLTIGMGIVVKNKLVGIFKKNVPLDVKMSARERGVLSVQNILQSLNQKLWLESGNIAFANEVTFFISPVGQVLLGIPKMGVGGALGPTFAFGFSKETDTLFVDVLVNFEKLKAGFVAFAGLRVTFGFNFDSSEEPGKRRGVQRLETNNPILIPIWEGKGETNYLMGGSFAIAVPPMPIDIFHYRNNVQKHRLLRLNITTIPLWTMVYRALVKINASEELLIRFEEKARLGVFAPSCERFFLL